MSNFVNTVYDIRRNHPIIKWLPSSLVVRGYEFFTAEMQAGFMSLMGYDGRDALRNYGFLDSDELTAEEYREQLYWDRMNLYAQMVGEGREKEFEWLRDWLCDARQPIRDYLM